MTITTYINNCPMWYIILCTAEQYGTPIIHWTCV